MDISPESMRSEIKRIKAALKGGRLFGRDIDENDPDEMIIAAYYYGKYEDDLKYRAMTQSETQTKAR